MAIIVADIHTPAQHIQHYATHPEAYRPQHCPHCGVAGMWCHGHYLRYPERENSQGPAMQIPRFRCPQPACGKSCSVLPECVQPMRWYLWCAQQTVLEQLLNGRLPDEQAHPHVRTVWRWWSRLKEQFHHHRLHLSECIASLGQHETARAFWPACFEQMHLSRAMRIVHQHGVAIP